MRSSSNTAPTRSTSAIDRARRRATLVAIPGILVLLALGSWQAQRLVWKNELNAFRATQVSAEPIALPTAVSDPEALAYRPVWVEGRFHHEGEMFLGARAHNRVPGYQVITPFERTDGTVVLVNRGWIPLERKEPETRPLSLIPDVTRVAGLLVLGGEQGAFTPDNVPEERFWYWVDLISLSEHAGIPAQSYLIDAGPEPNPGGLPIGGQTRVELRNEHLQYAIIWFGLALGLIGVYTLFMRKQAADRRNTADS